jgi:hypothetical protein
VSIRWKGKRKDDGNIKCDQETKKEQKRKSWNQKPVKFRISISASWKSDGHVPVSVGHELACQQDRQPTLKVYMKKGVLRIYRTP